MGRSCSGGGCVDVFSDWAGGGAVDLGTFRYMIVLTDQRSRA